MLLDNSQIIDDVHEDEKSSDHINDNFLSKVNTAFANATGTDEAKKHAQSNLFFFETKLEKFKLKIF